MGGSLTIYLFRWFEKKKVGGIVIFSYVNFFRCQLFKGQNHEFLSHIFQQCLHFVPGRISSRPKTSVLLGLKRKQFSPLYFTIYSSPFRYDCPCFTFTRKWTNAYHLVILLKSKAPKNPIVATTWFYFDAFPTMMKCKNLSFKLRSHKSNLVYLPSDFIPRTFGCCTVKIQTILLSPLWPLLLLVCLLIELA